MALRNYNFYLDLDFLSSEPLNPRAKCAITESHNSLHHPNFTSMESILMIIFSRLTFLSARTEYWVSQAKYWCKICKMWMSDTKSVKLILILSHDKVRRTRTSGRYLTPFLRKHSRPGNATTRETNTNKRLRSI